MLIVHQGKYPNIHETAFIAPTAVVCGDVTIGQNTQVSFGAVILAEGLPIVIGTQSIIRENVLIRSTSEHTVHVGDYVLVGPHASLMGCYIDDEVFLATGVTIFHGARIGIQSEVRVNGVVHVNSVLAPKSMVPIGWIAVGDLAEILPPNEHERIWKIQKPLNFPMTVYGLERSADGNVDMKEVTRRLATASAKHKDDKVIDGKPEVEPRGQRSA
jgi:carbonic anhydrase/acetyltransferase-like protein (isoleucine patch superfamily)